VHLTHAVLDAVLTASSTTKKGSPWGSLIFLVLILGVGYLFLLRPARARQRQQVQQRSQVEPGVEVVTTAGLLATVTAVDDDAVTLEIAPGVHSRFLKQAIARVVTPPEPEPEPEVTETPEETPPESQQT
jgi:preprotein translocase subunit YajC